MLPRTIHWPSAARTEADGSTGLRELKKRRVRQQLSDTATELFLERGFDALRVTDIAQACGVSEKTVYNYFPTKESLILDRWQSAPSALLAALADPDSLLDAALRVLDDELESWTSWLGGQPDMAAACGNVRRFDELVQATPSLRAYERDQLDRLVTQVAHVIARRLRLEPEDPEPRIAAAMLLQLWDIQARSLITHLGVARTPARLRELVQGDVHRARRVVAEGLNALDGVAQPHVENPPRAPSLIHATA